MDDPFSQMFNTLASSIAARSIAAAAAGLQAHHYNQLIAEGLPEETAIAVTAATSESLFTGVNKLIETIIKHPDELKQLKGVADAWSPPVDPTHTPKRGSDVEAWLQLYVEDNVPGEVHYSAYKSLLEDYRQSADEGQKLGWREGRSS